MKHQSVTQPAEYNGNGTNRVLESVRMFLLALGFVASAGAGYYGGQMTINARLATLEAREIDPSRVAVLEQQVKTLQDEYQAINTKLDKILNRLPSR